MRGPTTEPRSAREQVLSGCAGALAICVRTRYLLLALLTAALSYRSVQKPNCGSDYVIFEAAAQHLWRGQVGQVYSGARNQSGPLEAFWSVASTAGTNPCPAVGRTYLAGAVTALVVTALVVVFVQFTLPPCSVAVRQRIELASGLVGALALAPMALLWGHIADLVIPMLWILTYRSVVQRRPWLAGLFLAFGCGWESWAILGVPLLLAGGWRPAVKSGATALLGCLWYLPFAVSGHFAMFDMVWNIDPMTFIGHLTGRETEPWSLRLVQAVLVELSGCAAVWAVRGRSHAAWLPVLVIGATRVLSDPNLWPYYSMILIVPALVAASASATRLPRAWAGWLRLLLSGGGLLLVIIPGPGTIVSPLLSAAGFGLLLGGAWQVRRRCAVTTESQTGGGFPLV
jgi:hypothetical protein